MKNIMIVLLFVCILTSACANQAEPPQNAPPKPTWTEKPLGVFKGCLFYEGEQVVGGFWFENSGGLLNEYERLNTDCVELRMAPGEYVVWGFYAEGDCFENMCFADKTTIEILDGTTLELDLVVMPNN